MEHQPSSPLKFSGLLDREVPDLEESQIDVFEYSAIHTQKTGEFLPQKATEILKSSAGEQVIGIDIGGDKSLTQLYSVQPDGSLAPDDSFSETLKDRSGAGYIDSMEKTAQMAKERELPVGISIGIPLDGTKPTPGTKLPALRKELQERYANNFANLFTGKLACLNDGPAGVISGAAEANIKFDHPVENVIFIINGGGIGAAVVKEGVITATEAGHAPVTSELNIYEDTRTCTLFENTGLCVEQVAGNKEGIEKTWLRKTGESLNAVEIEKRFTQNQPNGALSLELYDYSALVVAHLAQGLAKAFDIDLDSPGSAVVGHGGAFKFPDYGKRIQQILQKHNNHEIQLILTKDYTQNACAEGAAVAALTQP